jgi:hypothetical protein
MQLLFPIATTIVSGWIWNEPYVFSYIIFLLVG